MLTFLLESSVKIFLEAKHSLSNQLSKCFFLLLSSGLLLTFSLDCRYLHIEPTPKLKTDQIYLSFPSAQTMRCRPPDKPPWLLCDARKDLGNLRPPPQQFAASNRPVVYERQPVKVATSHFICLSLMVHTTWYFINRHSNYSFSFGGGLVETISMWKLMMRPESVSWWKHNRYSQHFKWVYFFSWAEEESGVFDTSIDLASLPPSLLLTFS